MFTTVAPKHIGDWLKMEEDARYSREEVTIAANAAHNLLSGTVLGRVTATGAVVPLALGASDGSQNPYGVLCYDVDARAVPVRTPAIVRGNVMVSRDDIVYPAGATNTQKATIQAALNALGIVVRIPV